MRSRLQTNGRAKWCQARCPYLCYDPRHRVAIELVRHISVDVDAAHFLWKFLATVLCRLRWMPRYLRVCVQSATSANFINELGGSRSVTTGGASRRKSIEVTLSLSNDSVTAKHAALPLYQWCTYTNGTNQHLSQNWAISQLPVKVAVLEVNLHTD